MRLGTGSHIFLVNFLPVPALAPSQTQCTPATSLAAESWATAQVGGGTRLPHLFPGGRRRGSREMSPTAGRTLSSKHSCSTGTPVKQGPYLAIFRTFSNIVIKEHRKIHFRLFFEIGDFFNTG